MFLKDRLDSRRFSGWLTLILLGGFLIRLNELAALLSDGEDVPADPLQAGAAFQRSCDLGHAPGCSNLSSFVSWRRRTAAALHSGCNAGNGTACTDLALMYRQGDGVSRDDNRSRELLRRACDLGVADACDKVR